jgi:hypothetical protein
LTCIETTLGTRLQAISSLDADNCVERLVLSEVIFQFVLCDYSAWWLEADALIANTPMPALQRVELNVLYEESDFGVELLKSSLPRLNGRGLLSVKATRGMNYLKRIHLDIEVFPLAAEDE